MKNLNLNINITKIDIVHSRSGTDKISIKFDGPTPFPEMKYPPYLDIITRANYAEEWLEKTFGIKADDPIVEIIRIDPGYY